MYMYTQVYFYFKYVYKVVVDIPYTYPKNNRFFLVVRQRKVYNIKSEAFFFKNLIIIL